LHLAHVAADGSPTGRLQRQQVLVASAVAGTFMFALNMLSPLLPLAAVRDRAGAVGVGLAVGAAGLLPLVLALPAGTVAERLGPRRVVLPSVLLMVASLGLMAADQHLAALALGQVLKGLGQYGATLGLQTFVANLPGPRSRNETFAVFGIANSLGSLFAPALAGVVADRAGLPAGFVLAAVIASLSAAGALGLNRRLGAGSGARDGAGALRTARRVLRDEVVRLSLGSTMAILFTDSISTSFLPVFLQQAGLSVATIGLLISLRGLASLLVRPTIGVLTRGHDRWWLILGATAAEALGTVVVPVAPVMPVLVGAALCCGAATGYNQPLGMAIVADRLPRAERATALALRLGGNRFAGLAGPLAFGAVASALGLPAAFWAAGLASALAGCAVAAFQRRGGEAGRAVRGAAPGAVQGGATH
jgi:MFS family permease